MVLTDGFGRGTFFDRIDTTKNTGGHQLYSMGYVYLCLSNRARQDGFHGMVKHGLTMQKSPKAHKPSRLRHQEEGNVKRL